MPAALERKIRKSARRKHLKGKSLARYVYGTLRKTGWKPTPRRRR